MCQKGLCCHNRSFLGDPGASKRIVGVTSFWLLGQFSKANLSTQCRRRQISARWAAQVVPKTNARKKVHTAPIVQHLDPARCWWREAQRCSKHRAQDTSDLQNCNVSKNNNCSPRIPLTPRVSPSGPVAAKSAFVLSGTHCIVRTILLF